MHPFAKDPNPEVYYFLQFCCFRSYLWITRKTHLVCTLSIILSIFKIQLDFFSQGRKTSLQLMHKTSAFDSGSLLNAYKNSYFKYFFKISPYLDYDSSRKTGKHKGKTACHTEFTGKSGYVSTLQFIPFNVKMCLIQTIEINPPLQTEEPHVQLWLPPTMSKQTVKIH